MTPQEQLKLLSIFHYVVGGMHMLFGCFGIIHLSLGLIMLLSPSAFEQSATPPPPFIGYIFAGFGGAILLCGLILGSLTIASGLNIAKRQAKTFSTVVGCINCVLLPFGTPLGILTLIILTRQETAALYAKGEAQ